jgi:small subunit ribosomal protein S2
MPAASMKQLLESGVHFGHQTRRWNPKMKPYIFTERGGIHIIDLQQTTVLLDKSYDFVRNIAARGGTVMFVGTKKQCQDIIKEEAGRVGMPYVSHRWLGGLLTNFSTIERRIQRMHELRRYKEEGQLQLLPTKERMGMERELEKLEINLGGVAGMTRLPDAVFVADPKREAIGTKEVNKLGIPLIGLVDTNCDPDEVDYLIPGNDDAIRSCSLIIKTLVRAVEEGRAKFQVSDFLQQEAAREAAAAAAKAAAEDGRDERGGRDNRGRGQGDRRGGGQGGQGGRRDGGSRPYSSDAPGRPGGRDDARGGARPMPASRRPRPAAPTAPAAPAGAPAQAPVEKPEAAEKPADQNTSEA